MGGANRRTKESKGDIMRRHKWKLLDSGENFAEYRCKECGMIHDMFEDDERTYLSNHIFGCVAEEDKSGHDYSLYTSTVGGNEMHVCINCGHITTDIINDNTKCLRPSRAKRRNSLDDIQSVVFKVEKPNET